MGCQGQVVLIVSVVVGADEQSLRFVTESDVPQLCVGLVVTLDVEVTLFAVRQLPKTDRGVGSSLAPSKVPVFEHLLAFRVKGPVVPFAYKNIEAIVSAVTTRGKFYCS